jgi:hypothetical protein
MSNVDIIDMAGQAEIAASQTGEVLGAVAVKRSPSANKTGSANRERLTFDEFRTYVESYSDRLACRLDNARRPAEQRIDCNSLMNRGTPGGEAPAR